MQTAGSRPSRPIYLITGTSRGVGREMAQIFAESEALVIGCSRGIATFESEFYEHYQVDLTDEVQVRKWVREVRAKHARIDALVCNVGLVQSALFLSVTPTKLFNDFIQTNLSTAFLVCREVSKAMTTQQYGRIVTISSIMTALHEPGTSIYSATKSALTEMTKVLARELAPVGVTCNVVAPALMNTETSETMGAEWRARILEKQTIQRALEIRELCHAVSFFTSPHSSYVTGQVMNLCLVN